MPGGVHAPVLVEAAVLNGDDGFLHERGDLVQGNLGAVFRVDVAISLPSAARILVVWLGGSTFSSAGRVSKNSIEPLAALPDTAAAGTRRPATRTPQIALTPRKTKDLSEGGGRVE